MAAENSSPEPERRLQFAKHLGIREGQSEGGVGNVHLTIADIHRQEAGVVQGGLLTVLADEALYLAVRSTLNPGESTTTVELKINFLAPAREGELTATARLVSRGRRIAVGDYEITDQRQTRIAVGIGTCLISEPRP
ncbi:MAG: PaaI family thioesterase [Dehalococcoidia bacterium]